MTDLEIIKLEKRIKAKMLEIKNRKISLKDSGIGVMINALKKVDEAAYEKIFLEYKTLLNSLK